MKRSQVFHAAAAVLLFSACQKHIDIDPGQGLKFCRIVKLGLAPPQSTGDTSYPRVYISYNADGNPADMLYYSYIPYFGLDFHFRYDRQSRLKDWIFDYVFYEISTPLDPVLNQGRVEGSPVVWHRYAYPQKDIVLDSEFAYGEMPLANPDPPQSSFERVTTYKLDEQGRIIQTSDGPGGNPGNFNYDRSGDLVGPGLTYDDKLNPYRTNSVWMFVYQDYSIHNPLEPVNNPRGGSISYSNFNVAGLPQQLTASTGDNRFFYSFQQMTITYDCSCATPVTKDR